MIKIREICNSSIELKRAKKEIGSSLEANLIINLNEKMIKITEGVDFSELCITSDAKIEKRKSDEIERNRRKSKEGSRNESIREAVNTGTMMSTGVAKCVPPTEQ